MLCSQYVAPMATGICQGLKQVSIGFGKSRVISDLVKLISATDGEINNEWVVENTDEFSRGRARAIVRS